MEETFKLIIKYLQRKNWVYDGTKYIFNDILINDSYIQSAVDCILPKNGQSYTKLKFTYDIEDIMTDVYDIFGEKIAFQTEFFVDGKVAEDVYVSNETKLKIRKELKDIYFFKLKGKGSIETMFSCEVDVFPSNKKPIADIESISFSYFYDVFNITINDNSVKVDDSYYKEAKGYIENLMMDADFSPDISDVFYSACEDDFKFNGTNIFTMANGYLRKIDGVDNGIGLWSNTDNPTSFFTKITYK